LLKSQFKLTATGAEMKTMVADAVDKVSAEQVVLAEQVASSTQVAALNNEKLWAKMKELMGKYKMELSKDLAKATTNISHLQESASDING